MKLYKVGLVFLLIIGSVVYATPESAKSGFKAAPDLRERFQDVHTFLYNIAARNNWSLIVCSDLNSPLREVTGATIEDALNNYLESTQFGWRFYENCLYVAEKSDLKRFFQRLAELELTMPTGQANAGFSGNFERLEVDILCNMLKSVSGFEIRPASELQQSIMMRASGMSWQRVLLAVVYLNRFRMDRTDYSITIFPSDS